LAVEKKQRKAGHLKRDRNVAALLIFARKEWRDFPGSSSGTGPDWRGPHQPEAPRPARGLGPVDRARPSSQRLALFGHTSARRFPNLTY
jgi:hypothetical protein